MHTFLGIQRAHKIRAWCVCGLALQLLMDGLSKTVRNM